MTGDNNIREMICHLSLVASFYFSELFYVFQSEEDRVCDCILMNNNVVLEETMWMLYFFCVIYVVCLVLHLYIDLLCQCSN